VYHAKAGDASSSEFYGWVKKFYGWVKKFYGRVSASGWAACTRVREGGGRNGVGEVEGGIGRDARLFY
jgi:hypothetical protein